MTTTFLQGQTATLVVQWRQFAPDGPLTDVTSQTITVIPLAGGPNPVGPTATGIGHPATGVYTFNWAVPAAQTPGPYLVVWNAIDPGSGTPVAASETITVAASVTAGLPTGLCAPWDPLFCCDITAAMQPLLDNAVASASHILWQASGQRYGLCQVTVRPCRRDCTAGVWPWPDWWQWTGSTWPTPFLHAGTWFNLTCGGCSGGCSCTVLEETVLPAPVHDVVEVKVDGLPLPPNAYRLDDNRILVRVDGGRWPLCQELAKADSQPGTWSVTARFGEPPPTLGRQAVGELACEIMRACLGEDCRLPANVQQLVRQGVTISFPDNEDIVRRGYFGRLFLDTVNPHHLPGRPMVYDVDGPAFRRTGT